ncbi:MAG: DUF6512 family protein [Clostridia bacterium]
MIREKYFDNLKTKMLIWSVLLFVIGGLAHFGFQIFNNNFFIGSIFPVNESVFEHLKLAFYPLLIWWIVFFLKNKNNPYLSKQNIVVSACVSIFVSMLFIVSFHYTIEGAFNVSNVILDISSLYIGLLLGLFCAYLILKSKPIPKWLGYVSLILIIVWLIATIFFTYNPPNLPIFIEK